MNELRVRLAPGIRLRRDRVRGGDMLVGAERGLVLSRSAAAMLALCDGSRSIPEIARALAREHDEAEDIIERDVRMAIGALMKRHWLRAR